MNVESICSRAVECLFNGTYQGVLLAMAIWIAIRLLPRLNATTRHAVWFATLLAVAALPAAHLGRHAFQRLPRPNPAPSNPEIVEPITHVGPATEQTIPASPEGIVGAGAEAGLAHLAGARITHAVGHSSVPGTKAHAIPGASGSHASASDPVSTRGVLSGSGWLSGTLHLPPRASVFLIGVWILVTCVRLTRLGGECARLRSLRRAGTLPPAELLQLFHSIARELRLRRPTRLLMSSDDTPPMVVGFLHPAVLVPRNAFETAGGEPWRHVLRHELAHVVRHDDWTNLVQQVIRAVLSFHPAVAWVSRRVTLEREIACDDHVLAASHSPRDYALCLTEFARRMKCREIAAAPAAWNHKHQLTERITMILDTQRNSSSRLAGFSATVLSTATALAAGLALMGGPRVALAADNAPAIAATPATPSLPSSPPPALAPAGSELPPAEAAEPIAGVQSQGPRRKPARAADIEGGSLENPPNPRPDPGANPVPRPERPLPPAPPAPPQARRHLPPAEDGSMERRLERLERLVEEMAHIAGGRRNEAPEIVVVPKHEHEFKFEHMARLNAEVAKAAKEAAEAGLNEAEVAKIAERARKDAERAVRDAERAMKELHRTGPDDAGPGRIHTTVKVAPDFERHQLEFQRQVLERQRASLERQIASIDRKIQRLEDVDSKLKERDRRAPSDPLRDQSAPPSGRPGSGSGDEAPRKRSAE